jgi:ATP-dependent DNA helicase RecQ
LEAPCGNCDVCLEGADTWDGTIAAQKALSCVYRTGQRFGAAYLTDVLLGKDDDRIRRFGHHRLKTFGVGQELGLNEWRSVYRQLIAGGFLTVDIARHAGFRLTEKSWQILRSERAIHFRKDPRPTPRKKAATAGRPAAPDTGGVDSGPLWEALRRLRLDIARESGVPPFVIFHDRALKEMAALRPKTPEALLQVNGVGEAKLKRYGSRFLDAIREVEEAPIAKENLG